MMNIRPLKYKRRKSRTVYVGQVGVGGNNPIRVQSMTTSDTKDTDSIIPEMEGLVEAGCEIIRVTVPTQADCDNLPNIRAQMKKRGLKAPLVADIHFTPSIALKAVEFVEKIRVNPGNFADKKLFKSFEYTDAEYQAELERIREKFLPLVIKCKENGVAMRIGTNHGSLSDRIMNRYGDTPLGMVESALEFLRICEDQHYFDIVLSMKASNVQVMIEAYRLLALKLAATGRDYPFHLGVTEAGSQEEGRTKSAIGIGTLLEDGIGDTVRVSLTEDSIYEIPVAYQLVQKYNLQHSLSFKADPTAVFNAPIVVKNESEKIDSVNILREYQKPLTAIGPIKHGAREPLRCWLGVDASDLDSFLKEYRSLSAEQLVIRPLEGLEISGVESIPESKLNDLIQSLKGMALSAIIENSNISADQLKQFHKIVFKVSKQETQSKYENLAVQLKSQGKIIEWCFRISGSAASGIGSYATDGGFTPKTLPQGDVFSLIAKESVYAYRNLATLVNQVQSKALVHLRYHEDQFDSPLLNAATQIGALLVDGLGDSIQINSNLALATKLNLAYNILQGCRLRVSQTEYISCPSCGRTQFDLQTTTQVIRQKTSHLIGVKIAVMGCIVNGPGEMADADFGYVGTGPKKVSLYVGKECVERNLPEDKALESLVALIKKHDRWVEPPQVEI